MSLNNRDYIPKLLLAIILVVLVSAVGYLSLKDTGPGFSFSIYYGHQNTFTSVLVSSLILVVKLLWVVFIVSIILGTYLLLKRYIFDDKREIAKLAGEPGESYRCPCCGVVLMADFKYCPKCKASLNDICSRCGKQLQMGWSICPWCGQARKN